MSRRRSGHAITRFIVPAVFVLAFVGLIAFVVLQNASIKTRVMEESSDVTIRPLSKDDHILGEMSAPIQILVYSDPECSFCKRFFLETLPRLQTDFPNKLVVAYRHRLVSRYHRSPREAEAQECAGKIGGERAFWDYTYALLRKTNSEDTLELAELPKLALSTGLPLSEFMECLDTHAVKPRIDAEQRESAVNSFQVSPTFVMIHNGSTDVISGSSYTHLKAVLDAMLAYKGNTKEPL